MACASLGRYELGTKQLSAPRKFHRDKIARVPSSSAAHAQVALVLIDECHLLNDKRGSALEAGAVSRIKMISQAADMQQVQSQWEAAACWGNIQPLTAAVIVVLQVCMIWQSSMLTRGQH